MLKAVRIYGFSMFKFELFKLFLTSFERSTTCAQGAIEVEPVTWLCTFMGLKNMRTGHNRSWTGDLVVQVYGFKEYVQIWALLFQTGLK
jgi:hypothetical protein